MGLRDLAILVWMGSHSELHLGAMSVLFMARFLTWMAACSVKVYGLGGTGSVAVGTSGG